MVQVASIVRGVSPLLSPTFCCFVYLFTNFLRPDHRHSSAHIDIDLPYQRRHYDAEVDITLPHRRHYDTEIDVTERQYRSKFQPSYREKARFSEETVDPPKFQPSYREKVRVSEETVDPPRFQPTYREEVRVTEETVDPPRFKKDKMGYYDEDGKLFSFNYQHISHPK